MSEETDVKLDEYGDVISSECFNDLHDLCNGTCTTCGTTLNCSCDCHKSSKIEYQP